MKINLKALETLLNEGVTLAENVPGGTSTVANSAAEILPALEAVLNGIFDPATESVTVATPTPAAAK